MSVECSPLASLGPSYDLWVSLVIPGCIDVTRVWVFHGHLAYLECYLWCCSAIRSVGDIG